MRNVAPVTWGLLRGAQHRLEHTAETMSTKQERVLVDQKCPYRAPTWSIGSALWKLLQDRSTTAISRALFTWPRISDHLLSNVRTWMVREQLEVFGTATTRRFD